ncbi:unnamed protein product, partial [Brenthis ino]
MESIKESLSALTDLFNTRMNDFQQDLNKSSTPVTNHALPAEFSSFRSFILSVLNTLQRQVECLALEIDRQEMRRRHKMILFLGVPEKSAEDTTARVTSLVAEHLDLTNFSSASIKDSYRLGRSSDKPRPIVVKFSDVAVRNKVWYSKTKLKGTGITQSEFLTKSRHNTFLEARQRFGIGKCWTRDGYIHVIAPDGSRHRVECKGDLNLIPLASKSPPQTTAASKHTTDKVTVSRIKRTVKK